MSIIITSRLSTVLSTNIYNFYYCKNGSWYEANCTTVCSTCRVVHLDYYYVETIKELKEAGLLPENYPLLCCNCYASVQRRKLMEEYKNERDNNNRIPI